MAGFERTEISKAYGRGYNAGLRNHWPEHRPPAPPDPTISSLMGALQNLRDAADSACATLSEDDEFVKKLAPAIDAADAAMAEVTRWLKSR